MSKSKDTRQDCICRYKDKQGQLVCSCLMYAIKNNTRSVYPKTLEESHRGGFIFNQENPMLKCRSCKYYCNDFSEYLKLLK